MKNNTIFDISVDGFEAKIHWSYDDNVYVGHLILKNQQHSVCFSSVDIEGLEYAMKEAVECYLENLEQFGDDGEILIAL